MNSATRSVGIFLSFPAERESWAHGVVESAVKDVKMTASAIQTDQPTLEPKVTLMLACAALNATEYTKGYSSFQWAYGKDYVLTDEDLRTFKDVSKSDASMSYEALVRARLEAEAVARKTRSLRVLSKLKNSKVRQLLCTFHPTQLVQVWRKQLPSHLHQGKCGGGKLSIKPHWIGPGRVIFREVLPHQDHDDHRRHLVWVLIGNQLMRCSVHSVRSVTSSQQIAYEIGNKDDPTQWRSIADILPARDYVDLTDQVPGEEECEEPDLPRQPDSSTTIFIPKRRVTGKNQLLPENAETADERLQRLAAGHEPAPRPVNDYNEEYEPESPLRDDEDGRVAFDDGEHEHEPSLLDDTLPYEQPEKKQKTEEISMLSYVATVSEDGVHRTPHKVATSCCCRRRSAMESFSIFPSLCEGHAGHRDRC